MLAGLCASALLPIAMADSGAEAGLVVLGSVGSNVLATLISQSLDAARARTRLRSSTAEAPTHPDGPDPAFADQVREEIAARIEEVLSRQDGQATELAGTLAVVLERIDATALIIRDVVVDGHDRLLEDLKTGFTELGDQLDGISPLLRGLDGSILHIQRTLSQQAAERRLDRSRHEFMIALLLEFHEQLTELIGRPPGDANPAGRAEQWIDCPYQGLRPFGPDQAGVFFGRRQSTARLLTMVVAHVHDGPIIVTGDSGAGKSSLLRAGLVPKLDWTPIVFDLGADPLRMLAVQMAARCNADADQVLAELRADPAGAAIRRGRQILEIDRIRRASGERRLILVVDQFEELFTLASGPSADLEEVDRFLTAVDALTRPAAEGAPDEPVGVVVLAIRGDFLGRCAAYPILVRALERRTFVLGPMTEQELRRTITGPAAAAGLRVEEGLAQQIVEDLVSHVRGTSGPDLAGALPLLSVAMARTWANREGDRLTHAAYDRAGGVASAVTDAAEATYADLDSGQRRIARRIFLALTVTGSDGRSTRRRAFPGELTSACAPDPPQAVWQVVEAFTAARLMVVAQVDDPGDDAGSVVELAHDILVTTWPRLHGWLKEDLDDRVLHGTILRDAAAWREAADDAAFLYRGARLETARLAAGRWRADPGRYPALTPLAGEFLRDGARAATRYRRRWRTLSMFLAGFLVIAVTAGVIALRFGLDARTRNAEVLSRQIVTYGRSFSDDPVTSARLIAAAWSIAPTEEARAAMVALVSSPIRGTVTHLGDVTALGPTGTIMASATSERVRTWNLATREPVHDFPVSEWLTAPHSLALDPGGRFLATGEFADVRIWDLAERAPVGRSLGSHRGDVTTVAFSPDGARLVSVSQEGIQIWDLASRRRVGPVLGRRTDSIQSLAYNPDGTRLASGEFGKVRIWDPETGRRAGPTITGFAGEVPTLAFSPDGGRLAFVISTKIHIHDAVTGEAVGPPLTGHTGTVNSLVFSDDGARLISGADDGIRIWDTAAHEQIGALGDPDREVTAVAFAANGDLLSDESGDVRIWDATTHQQVGGSLSGHEAWVESVTFDHGGARIASASADKTVRVWDTATHRQIGAPMSHDGGATAVAFSPDGTRLASAAGDMTVRIWDPATRQPVGVALRGHVDRANAGGTVTSVAFSPDGADLVSAADDATLRIWDLSTRKQVGTPLVGRTRWMNSVAYSPDGERLVSGSNDRSVRIWDTGTHEQIGATMVGHTGAVNAVDFSPDGGYVASSSDDGTVRMWDAATSRQAGTPLTGHTGRVTSVTFSPDGTYAASSSDDGTVRMWDTATHQEVGILKTGPADDVAFSPDGKLLATANTDSTVRIWDVGMPADLLGAVCAIAGRGLTSREWRQHIADVGHRPTCGP